MCCESKAETMFVKSLDDIGFPERVIDALPDPIFIEESVLTAQEISSVLKVVVHQVFNDFAAHVCMVVVGSKTGEHH